MVAKLVRCSTVIISYHILGETVIHLTKNPFILDMYFFIVFVLALYRSFSFFT